METSPILRKLLNFLEPPLIFVRLLTLSILLILPTEFDFSVFIKFHVITTEASEGGSVRSPEM
jgi:hypothetical protein